MNGADWTSGADVCRADGAEPCPPAPSDKLGLAKAARSERPVHGLRVPPGSGLSGWYLWAGEMSQADDFFEPSHVAHVGEICPLAVPFLDLPPGWRFLTDGAYVDVWYDASLLERRE